MDRAMFRRIVWQARDALPEGVVFTVRVEDFDLGAQRGMAWGYDPDVDLSNPAFGNEIARLIA